MLGVDCCVLMGANIASEIGQEQLTEAVIGYYNRDNAKIFHKLFDRDYFICNMLPDPGAEMCGTLKNIIAIGAGIVDGLGSGSNSKAAIMRIGLSEMRKFSKALYPTIRDETFLETCGVADLIATCYGGRNRKCAEEWARSHVEELLGGQKLQGTLTANEVYEIIEMRGWELEYPLFTTEGARMKLSAPAVGPGKRKNPLPSMDV
eukprot:gene22252-29322_t